MAATIPFTDTKIKSLPKWLLILLLTGGAALTLGLLSFGGIYALIPLIPVAGLAFGLSTIYESEIYFQNISLTIDKLTKYNYLQRYMARKLLLEKAKIVQDENDCQFLKDYRTQLDIVRQFHEKKLDAESKERKKKAEKELSHMEKWFAELLFRKRGRMLDGLSDYEREVFGLVENKNGILSTDELDALHDKYHSHKWYYRAGAGLAIAGGLFTTLGTVFLLGDILPLIPLVAGLSAPALVPFIITASVLAGIAYGLLVYNAVTDMINNETLKKFFTNIKEKGRESIPKAILMGLVTTVLIGLAVTLTVFTAGTWWTIAKNSGPILSWLQVKANIVYKAISILPKFIMGIIHPIVMGASAMVFNIENSSESYETLSKFAGGVKQFFSLIWDRIKTTYQRENFLQFINPGRLITKAVVIPLRFCLFIGHLISIGVTADRFPGISSIITALVGTLCEGMEDLHYFAELGHHNEGEEDNEQEKRKHFIEERLEGEGGHDHGNDLPTKLINLALAPVKLFLTLPWAFLTSQLNRLINDEEKQPLTLTQAFKQTFNFKDEENIPENAHLEDQKSQQWHKAHLCYHIDKFKRKRFGSHNYMNSALANEKKGALDGMANAIKNHNGSAQQAYDQYATNGGEDNKRHYRKLTEHRGVGFFSPATTKSKDFIDDLTAKVPAAAAA